MPDPAGSTPTIGIALAAYRPAPQVFARQLQSLCDQTWTRWICAITVDHDLDPLRRWPELEPYFRDSRFTWHANPIRLGHRQNFAQAMNIVAHAGVDAIAFSDQDDIWYPSKLERCLARLQQAPPLSLVHCDMHMLDHSSGIVHRDRTVWEIEQRCVERATPEDLLIHNVVAGCAALFDAEIARRYPTIPDECEYHDAWIALLAACHGGVHAIHDPLYAYRQHLSNVAGWYPYQSYLDLRGRGPWTVLRTCVRSYERARELAAALTRHVPDAPSLEPSLAVAKLAARGLWHLPGPRPLSRACFSRAIGRSVRLFVPPLPEKSTQAKPTASIRPAQRVMFK